MARKISEPNPALFVNSPWWLAFAAWLNPQRLRMQAMILMVCLWGSCAVDFSTSGLMDRAGNIKFQDFLQFYISGRLIAQERTVELYDQRIAWTELHNIVRQPTRVILPTVYGPQVGLFFRPLVGLSFFPAAGIWVGISVVLYLGCVLWLWKSCANLRPYAAIVALATGAFPPLFHFFVRGQISVLLLVCFTLCFLAFRSAKNLLAGMALGLLVFKPQFLVAIPLVLLLAKAWKPLLGLLISATTQIGLTWLYFGTSIMRSYFDMLLHVSRWIGVAELAQAQAQMHSLRSFWLLLAPWHSVAFLLYALSSIFVLALAAASWRSHGALALRFSSLIFAAVLINPHLFVYDLLVLAPALLLTVDWALGRADHPLCATIKVLAYLSFLLPLLGPLTVWTHFQLSVPVFVALQIALWISLRDAKPGYEGWAIETA